MMDEVGYDVQDGVGMGVAFSEVDPEQLKTLDSWLAELQE